eukprot:scaffold128_cov328-Pavlova_lutheri.AAC.25
MQETRSAMIPATLWSSKTRKRRSKRDRGERDTAASRRDGTKWPWPGPHRLNSKGWMYVKVHEEWMGASDGRTRRRRINSTRRGGMSGSGDASKANACLQGAPFRNHATKTPEDEVQNATGNHCVAEMDPSPMPHRSPNGSSQRME